MFSSWIIHSLLTRSMKSICHGNHLHPVCLRSQEENQSFNFGNHLDVEYLEFDDTNEFRSKPEKIALPVIKEITLLLIEFVFH